MAKLKVYRTPIGFHDAYVAAPSQKAALLAWGSDADLFARGIAEVVTEPALTAEPLANPGVVVKRSRGTAAEQFAALPSDPPASRIKPKAVKQKAAKPAPAIPRPDRAALDAAERALGDAEQRQHEAERALAAEAAALATRARELRAAHRRENHRLVAQRDAAAVRYAKALKRWQQS